MQNSKKLVEDLKSLLRHKKSKDFYAQRLNVTRDIIDSLLQEIRGEQSFQTNEVEEGTFKKFNFDKGSYEITTYYDHEPTPEEVIRDHKINTKEYKLSGYWSKAKEKGWHVSANFTKLQGEENVAMNYLKVLENYKSVYEPSQYINSRTSSNNPTMVEISLADYHLDKMGIEGETLEERATRFISTAHELITKASNAYSNIQEIVFVVGNDFFNSDGWNNGTTVHQNIQDNNSLWDRAYETGFDILVQTITMLMGYAPKVKVIVVPGNHAKVKEFYLGHALQAYFRQEPRLEFDRKSTPRKIHIYGNTLIGYHHGNCKIDQLPLLMATEFYEAWGKCKYKEIHVGDKHFMMEKEIHGVRIKQIPAMSPTDRWHDENNYIGNIRAAVASIYDYHKGKIAELETRI